MHDGRGVVAAPLHARRPPPRRAARSLRRGCARRGRGRAGPTSPTSPSAWGRGRSPACGSASSPPGCSACALGVPVHGVCSLDALALQVAQDPATASRRGAVRRGDRRPPARGLLGALPGRRRGRTVATAPTAAHVDIGRRAAGRVRTSAEVRTLYPDVLGRAGAARRRRRRRGPSSPCSPCGAPGTDEPRHCSRPTRCTCAARTRRRRGRASGCSDDGGGGRRRQRAGRCAGGTSRPCRRLERELFGTTAWTAAMFWSELAAGPSRWYVVGGGPRDAVVAGYAGLLASGSEADVQTIAVAPAAQGRGRRGTLLLRSLVTEAARRGRHEPAARGAGRQRPGDRASTAARLRADRASAGGTTSPATSTPSSCDAARCSARPRPAGGRRWLTSRSCSASRRRATRPASASSAGERLLADAVASSRRRARPVRRRRPGGRQPGAPGGDGADDRAGLRARPASGSPTSTPSPSRRGRGSPAPCTVGVAAAKALAVGLGVPPVRCQPPGRPRRGRPPRARPACRSRRWRCWSPAGTRRCCWCPTSPATSGRSGATIDDAAGEAFDKVARLLGLPFPGGP